MKPFDNQVYFNELPILLNHLKSRVYRKVADFDVIEYESTPEPVAFGKWGKFEKISIGQKWGNLFDCAWFHLKGRVPKDAMSQSVVFILDISGEGCIYDTKGNAVKGITSVTTTFDESLGKAGKRVVRYDKACGEEVEFYIDAGCNDLFGKYQRGELLQAHIAVCDEPLRALYYDFLVLYETLQSLSKDGARYYQILYAVREAFSALGAGGNEQIAAARAICAQQLNRDIGDAPLSFTAIGHAHLDLAWLWPIRETKRKAVRTFCNALESIGRYPDFIFGASQAQQFEWIKQSHPELFEKIKAAVKAGKIEIQGAMWVEPDLNATGGESLVRQIMYGTEFFDKEFGVRPDNLWLPDVFGFNGALPQIAAKSGIKYLMTIKLSWNTVNEFPYHTFLWKGAADSELLTHMAPEGTYNSECSPKSLAFAEKRYREKGLCDEALVIYGIGDGGGGPSPIHIERMNRLAHISGVAPVKPDKACNFFHRLEKYRSKLNSYRGEMYLEKHQGTFTTQARGKFYNRRIENLLRAVETYYVSAGLPYPAEQLKEIWKQVLLLQFHDILPGSSIKRVYDESVKDYISMQDALLKLMSKNGEKFLYNASPFHTRRVFDGKIYSAKPYATAVEESKASSETLSFSDTFMQNAHVRAEFNSEGEIMYIGHQARGVNLLKTPVTLELYSDIGDAWDMECAYAEKKLGKFSLKEFSVKLEGGVIVRRQTLVFGQSVLKQTIELSETDLALRIKNEIDWQQSGQMLRCEYRHILDAVTVDCDAQFSFATRPLTENNSLDSAQCETVCHKWARVKSGEEGLALINDCKYGLRAKGDFVSLNLLRSTSYPGEDADKGCHTFGLMLYPIFGRDETAKIAYEFNNPLLFCGQKVECPIEVEGGSVIIETLKKAEDGVGYIARLYEYQGKSCDASLRADGSLSLTTLTEQTLCALESKEGSVKLHFKPFEIHTVKVF